MLWSPPPLSLTLMHFVMCHCDIYHMLVPCLLCVPVFGSISWLIGHHSLAFLVLFVHFPRRVHCSNFNGLVSQVLFLSFDFPYHNFKQIYSSKNFKQIYITQKLKFISDAPRKIWLGCITYMCASY